MLSFETNISIAVSSVETFSDLEKVIDRTASLSHVVLDRDTIISVWRDIKRVPVHHAVRSWRNLYEP